MTRALPQGFHKLFPEYVGKRPADGWGAITVWAWAASRILDYFRDGAAD